ncbi:MAG: hypothetical protein IT379_09350 [Deltaproteobacteria bacterium]|nr:hypothetical protein [Deltaproteobacteria bacterium]
MLLPCVGCSRHVLVESGACPFCGTAAPRMPPIASPSSRPIARSQITRAAIFLGATVVGGGCGPRETVQPVYGAPPPSEQAPPPSEQTPPPSEQAPRDPGEPAAVYGAPPEQPTPQAPEPQANPEPTPDFQPDPGARIYGAPPAPSPR